jgi:hypothetical protein
MELFIKFRILQFLHDIIEAGTDTAESGIDIVSSWH